MRHTRDASAQLPPERGVVDLLLIRACVTFTAGWLRRTDPVPPENTPIPLLRALKMTIVPLVCGCPP